MTSVERESYAYGWPLKPFHRQHPVRGFFGDPRIADHGQSRQFHFGVDVSGANGTPVYTTLTGTASIHQLHPDVVLVSGTSGLQFSYWHVVPTIRNGQRVVAYETVIGHIEKPWAHVHFAEARNGVYLNPLRPGLHRRVVGRVVRGVLGDEQHLRDVDLDRQVRGRVGHLERLDQVADPAQLQVE